MRQRRHLLMFALALLCLSFAACGAKQYPMQITVVNRSTYPITDLRISLISEEDWGENRLETTLEEGESAGIDLGEYTEEQLNAGFHLQFYGEDGQPVNPDYDPSSPTFFENGDFLIFSPPDLSIALFLDTAYDPETYDQKIVELYAADGDGRGDVISQNGIPVLMGGALPFTNMQNLLSENHDNGTYRYEDITEDGQLLVVNAAEQSCFVPDVQELDDYLTACLLGGILTGIGSGIVLTCGGSGGGLDVLGLIMSKRDSAFTVGKFALGFNALLYTAILILFDPEVAIYSVIYNFANSMILDRMHQQNVTVQALIFTREDESVLADFIIKQLGRSVTYWDGVGAYTKDDVRVLCVCLSKYEIEELLHMVHSVDPHAFLTVQEGVRVFGNFPRKLG